MICVSLTHQSYEQCLAILSSAEMVELRLDLLTLTTEELHLLLTKGVSCIATCREGKYDANGRMEVLKRAIVLGASYVDVELEADDAYKDELIAYARSYGCKVIISHHDMEQTPDLATLNQLVDNCKRQGATVVKIVTTAHSERDAAIILSLYAKHTDLVAFAMGNDGKITRLACALLGAPFTYASADKGMEAASGQLTVNDMRSCYTILNQ